MRVPRSFGRNENRQSSNETVQKGSRSHASDEGVRKKECIPRTENINCFVNRVVVVGAVHHQGVPDERPQDGNQEFEVRPGRSEE